MTNEQKKAIAELRSTGATYAKIGEALGLSMNTVKTYCRRNNVNIQTEAPSDDDNLSVCRECGVKITQIDKQKKRIFCSRECRGKWWHAHPEMLNKKAVYDFHCLGCGVPFSAYGNKNRKYCSHECYITARFKGGVCHE